MFHKSASPCFLCVIFSFILANSVFAIPSFSRKYKVGCDMCHTIYPQLNSFGRDFKNNGFRTPDELDSPSKEKSFWDKGFDEAPLDLHGKINQEFYPNDQRIGTETGIDEIQLNAGINFSQKVAFYLHTHLWESGHAGKPLAIEVRINDLFGTSLVNLRAGQYELPLSFSPEIERLMAFSYLIYSQSIGGNSFSIDQPQLGVELTGDLGNDFWYWAGMVNGNGFETDPVTGLFDNNPAKDFYFRLAKNFDENTIGLFGYIGDNSVYTDSINLSHQDNFLRIGGDVSINIHNINIRTSIVHGSDNNYDGLNSSTSFHGGFVECNYFQTDRLVFVGRYEVVWLKNMAASPDPTQPQTSWAITPGFQYLILPNVKVGLEYQVRQTASANQALALLHFVI